MRNVSAQKLEESPAPSSGLGFTPTRSNNAPSGKCGEGPCHDVTAGADAQQRGSGEQKDRCGTGDKMWRLSSEVGRVTLQTADSKRFLIRIPFSSIHLNRRSSSLIIKKE